MEKYTSRKQVIKDIKKLMIDDEKKAVDIAAALGVKPQGLQKIFGKKNFSFDDAKKILDALGYDLYVGFKPKEKSAKT